MPYELEICENCQRVIGSLETPMVWRGRVVCFDCDALLRRKANTDAKMSPAPATPPADAAIGRKNMGNNKLVGLFKALCVFGALVLFMKIFQPKSGRPAAAPSASASVSSSHRYQVTVWELKLLNRMWRTVRADVKPPPATVKRFLYNCDTIQGLQYTLMSDLGHKIPIMVQFIRAWRGLHRPVTGLSRRVGIFDVKGIVLDGWGRPIEFNHGVFVSAGPDGKFGTADDIASAGKTVMRTPGAVTSRPRVRASRDQTISILGEPTK